MKMAVLRALQRLLRSGFEPSQVNPIMGCLGNSLAPFKLFDATVVESLLTNCESWIGIAKH